MRQCTCEGFVLLADGLHLILALFVGRLQLVELSHIGATLPLAVVQFQLQFLILLAPLGRELVKHSLLLIQSRSCRIRLVTQTQTKAPFL